jgi:hypothetical protein
MSIKYVHTLGDSTLDNLYWMLNSKGSNETQANNDSVEGQLQKRLNTESLSTYQVVSHAYDGFTTSSVLEGDDVGRVLSIRSGVSPIMGNKKAYLKGKSIDLTSKKYHVHPLNDLKAFVEKNPTATHYVVISVGGNDFRERLSNPIAMLREIPHIHERYLQILKEIKTLKDRDVRPILMLQYRLNVHDDRYYIYTILKVIGLFFSALHSLGLLGIGFSAAALVAKKIQQRIGLVFLIISSAVLALSHRIIPLKVTKGVLMGQQVSMAALGGLMETFYRPLLAQAKAEGIPILDLPNTFNPNDSSLYIAQIEPSQEGSKLIAEGIDNIIKRHDFTNSRSVMYSKRDSDERFIPFEPESGGWSVAYPAKQISKTNNVRLRNSVF